MFEPFQLPAPEPAPVREENPRITVITGLEGPFVPGAGWSAVREECPDGAGEDA